MRLALAALLTIAATQAAALSCLRPDPLRTLEHLDYPLALVGSFNERGDVYTFVGTFIDGSPVTLPISVTEACAGPWCGELRAETLGVFLAENEGESIHLTLDPCHGTAFYEPTPETLSRIEKALK